MLLLMCYKGTMRQKMMGIMITQYTHSVIVLRQNYTLIYNILIILYTSNTMFIAL